MLSRRKFNELFEYVPRLSSDAVVINSNNEVLLVKRSHTPYKDRWALPGGFVNKGEMVEKAAIRECFEESGIKTRMIKLVGIYSDPRRDPRGHVVTIVFLLKPLNSKTRPSNETIEAKFFKIKEIPKRLAADHNKILRDALGVWKTK